jgi:DNA polymerase I
MAFDPNNLRMNLVENFDDLVEFMAWIRAGHRFIGVDIETDGLDWYDGKIRLVQFGTMTEGYAVPYERFTGAIYEALRSLRDAGTLIIGHNIGGFDLTWLRRHGGFEPNWANVHDSMILAALLDTAGSKALKTLSTVYVSPVAAYGQTALKDDMARYGLTWETVPIELPSYWVYGIMDTILTVHLFFELYRRCEGLGLIDAYNTERHVEKILHQVSWNGMLVDQDHLHHQRDFWRSRCAELQVICNDQYGIDNIGSTHQLIDAFLNNGVILTEKTPTGKWAMNSDAFKIIEAVNGSHPIVSAVAEYRKGMKYIGSYYDPVERYTRSDGRIHPYYRQMQARTLRMSANDPAIQTFPRDPEVRNMLVAADGCSYISADFSNMEARIFACLAPDEGMKQAFRDGVDLHCYTGGLMYNGGTPIEKNDPRRQLSKSSLFSCVPKTTRAVTKRGVVHCDDLVVGEEILAYDPQTGTTKWTPMIDKAVYNDGDAPVYRIGNKNRSFVTTATHRWPVMRATRGADWRGPREYYPTFAQTNDYQWEDIFVHSAPLDHPDRPDLSVDEVALFAWLLTDGCVRWSTNGTGTSSRGGLNRGVQAQITQKLTSKNGDSTAHIQGLIGRNPEWFGKVREGGGCLVYSVRPQIVRDIYTKCGFPFHGLTGSIVQLESFVISLGSSQLAEFANVCYLAEGWKTTDKGGRAIAQNRGPALDAMRMAFFLVGNFPGRNSVNKTNYPTEHTNVTFKIGSPTTGATRFKVDEVGTDQVWCPKTAYETWVAVDDDGMIFITGNTMFGGGVDVLAITAGIPHALAQETSRTLHKAFPSIKKHSRDMQEEAATMAAMDTTNHRTGIRLADGRILRMDPGDDRLYAYQNYCLPRDTDVLTEDGWVRIDHIDAGTKVMGYVDGALQYTSVTDTHKMRSRLVTLRHQMFEVKCTPNHRWLVTNGDVEEYQQADSLKPGWSIKISAPSDHVPSHGLRDSDIYVLAWVLTDGHVNKGNTMIHQKKANEITTRLDAYGVPYRTGSVMTNGVVPYRVAQSYATPMWNRLGIDPGNVKGADLTKLVLRMSRRQREMFIDECCKADGSTDSKGHRVFNQSTVVNKNVCDALILAVFLQGGHAFHSVSSKSGMMTLRVDGKHPVKTPLSHGNRGNGMVVDSNDYNQHPVYCLTTETSNFVIRQGKTVTITGNSIQGSARMVLAHSLISMDNAGIMEHGVAVIHDEIVVEVPDDIADDVAFAIAEHMPNDVMFDLPISVGVGKPSKRFGDADH